MSADQAARDVARARFVAAIEAHPIRLDEATAWIAAEEHPQTDGDDLLALLDVMAEGLWMPPGVPVAEQIARLNQHVFTHHKFAGDLEHYQQPQYSCLDTVLHERRGLPILLCVVYMEIARRVGVDVEGIGFPGHFLVSPADGESRFFIDPFNAGRVLRTDQLHERLQRMSDGSVIADPQRFLATVPNRYVLVRICNNLKGAYLRNKDVDGAIRATERLVLLDPKLLDEWRELGLMHAHQGNNDAAIEALESYLRGWPDAPDTARISAMVASLKQPS